MYNSKQAWVVTSVLFLGQIINYFDKSVIGLAAVPIMQDLHLTPQQYGFIASSFYSLFAVSGIIVGMFLSQRVSSKILLAALVLIWSLAQMPVVFFGSLATLVVGRVILGIGEGPATSTATSACHEWFTTERRNMPTAMLMMGNGAGSFLAGPILSYVIILHGWRAAFLVCGVLGISWLALWLVLGADGPGRARAQGVSGQVAAVGPLPSIRQASVWSDPTIIAIIAVAFASQWAVSFVLAWLAPLARNGLGYGAATTGWIVMAVAGTNSTMLFGLSYISQLMLNRGVGSRWARGVFNGVCMLGSGGVLLAASMVVDPVAKLVLLAIGSTLALVTFTMGPTLISEVTPRPYRAKFLITITSGATIAGFLAPLATGRMIGRYGLAGYNDGMMLSAAVVTVGGVIGVWLLRPERSIAHFAHVARTMAPVEPVQAP